MLCNKFATDETERKIMSTPYSPPAPPNPELPATGRWVADQESRNYALIAHLSGPVLSLLSAGSLIFLGPLVIMLVKPDNKWVREQAVEALNFAILNLIVFIVGFILMFVLVGFVVLAVAGVCYLVFGIMGAVRAYNGESYRYPYNWRIVK